MPVLLGPQKEFTILREKIEAFVKSIPDDKEELTEDKEIWIEHCRKEGAELGHVLTLSKAKIAAASSVVESVQLFCDQLHAKKVAMEQAVKEMEKAVAEAGAEADEEDEEEAPMPKRKVHPTTKKSAVVLESEVEQPMPKDTGLSPYFMVHGIEPIFPFDLAEGTFLVELPGQDKFTTTDLIAYHTCQLQK
ncbi:hypothetical protein BDR04DRAFT_1158307 [Suillus decipiens]|nr:hypothetical protein BDR04DRAFT_1158307 [Suillus decipiens]